MAGGLTAVDILFTCGGLDGARSPDWGNTDGGVRLSCDSGGVEAGFGGTMFGLVVGV